VNKGSGLILQGSGRNLRTLWRDRGGGPGGTSERRGAAPQPERSAAARGSGIARDRDGARALGGLREGSASVPTRPPGSR
jgi:hypothetical protein